MADFGTALISENTVDLYEHAPCGYLSLLPDGTIGNANATFTSFSGYDAPDLIGKRRFLDLLTVGGRIYYETHFQPLLRMHGQVGEIAFDLIRRDGVRLPILVNARQHDDPGIGTITRITVFDAADRRRYERELLAARRRAEEESRAKADLIATISHDVRGPLSAIMTGIALLERSAPTSEQTKYLQILQSSASRALTLVNNLLEIGRLDAGRATLYEQPFSLRELIDDVAAGARAAALQNTQLRVTSHVDDGIPDALIGDRTQIGQVLTNLMLNAVKFTERGVVALVMDARQVAEEHVAFDVSVADTGIGIAPDSLSTIFEEYTQDRSAGKHYGGVGLGLAITRRVLRLYGADLSVSSAPAVGTTFSFSLKLKRAPAV